MISILNIQPIEQIYWKVDFFYLIGEKIVLEK